MSHFRTTVPFWEHQVILHLFFLYRLQAWQKTGNSQHFVFRECSTLGQLSHGSIGIVQKIEFEIRTGLWCRHRHVNHRNVEKSGWEKWFWTIRLCVCVCVCARVSVCVCARVWLSVCRSCCSFSANSHGRKGKPIEMERCMFGHIRHCVVSIFVSICPPIFKIIQ